MDPEAWGFQEREDPTRYFTYLTAGFGIRKNCVQVVDAFKKVFPDGKPIGTGPIPRLICRSADDVFGEGVFRVSSPLSEEEEISLYSQAHCYVSGSLGEGWGMMPNQAIAQGCPTILGDAHGHAEFAHYGIPIKTKPYDAKEATFWGDGGQWWKPDFDEMCEAMRYVYSEWEDAKWWAAQASKMCLDQFNWDRTAEKVLFELPEVFNDPPTQRTWKPATPRMYLVRVNKFCTYTVNGQQFQFQPGQDYYESGDLKRSMLLGGNFDMSAFDPHEEGLDADKVEDLQARNGRCALCHQRFGSDSTLQEAMGR